MSAFPLRLDRTRPVEASGRRCARLSLIVGSPEFEYLVEPILLLTVSRDSDHGVRVRH